MFKVKILSGLLFITVIMGGCSNVDKQNDSASKGSDIATNAEVFTKGVEVKGNIDDILLEINQYDPISNRIENLESLAKYYIKNGSDKDSQENLNKVLKELDSLYPQDTKYLLGEAYSKIASKEFEEAFVLYKEAFNESLESDGLYSRGIYAKAIDREDIYTESKSLLKTAKDFDENKLPLYDELAELVERTPEISINTNFDDEFNDKSNIFVLLGFVLNEDGSIQEELINRLEVAKEALKKSPDSKIIVSGGVLKNKHTESEQMKKWLIENGISEKRIIEEDMSRDTVENCLLSMKLVKQQKDINKVTIISSSSHIVRAESLFKLSDFILSSRDKTKLKEFNNISFLDVKKIELKEIDKVKISRDLLRLAGYWQYPGLSR